MKLHLLKLIAVLSCAAPAPLLSQTLPNKSTSAIVHHFTRASTVIEQGDTITWIHSARVDSSGKTAQYVFIYLVRPDTVILLKPNGPRPLQPFYAKGIRDLLRFARDQDDLEKKLGHPLH